MSQSEINVVITSVKAATLTLKLNMNLEITVLCASRNSTRSISTVINMKVTVVRNRKGTLISLLETYVDLLSNLEL